MSDGLRATNLDAFFAAIEAWAEEQEQLATKVAVGIAYHALYHIANNSAQFLGDFAANWNVSVGSADESFTENILNTDRVRIQGDQEAVQLAFARNRGRLATFKLGDSIHLANSAHHEEDYAWMIEDNQIKFRPGNSDRPMGNWLDMAAALWSRPLNAQAAAQLAENRGGLS
jgi:hypothetical protein